MKKKYITTIIILVVLAALYQYFLGSKRLYYNKDYDLFIMTTSFKRDSAEIKMGKHLFNLDCKIRSEFFAEFSLFYFILKDDTLYLFDDGNKVLSFSSGGGIVINKMELVPEDSAIINGENYIIAEGYQDSTILKSSKHEIHICDDLVPRIFEERGKYYEITPFQRLF